MNSVMNKTQLAEKRNNEIFKKDKKESRINTKKNKKNEIRKLEKIKKIIKNTIINYRKQKMLQSYKRRRNES